tara:strand:- start:6595 stop:8580 length:1986 start_codon:yes stop_codon:yes gene_type:complete
MVELIDYSDKFGKRIGMKYPYNPDLNNALKSKIGFPGVKWDGEHKVWSIQDNRTVILIAAETLVDFGLDGEDLYNRANIHPVDQRNPNDCWVEESGTRLKVHWPFIKDAELREQVRLAIRSIDGRKFEPLAKCWSIPLAQGKILYNTMKDLYPPLAEAILNCDAAVHDVWDSIRRVEMSSAAELSAEDLKDIDNRLESRIPPHLELYPFQKVGVAFAEASNGRCLIGDEMGVGKTIQAIGYAAINHARPGLIVCPANVKYNWQKEIKKWLPAETVQVIDSSKTEMVAAEFYIITYDLLVNRLQDILRIRPQLTIIDEAHYIKNSKAQRTVATMTVARHCPKVIALSGTAIASRPKEFFNVLNLLRPDEFNSEWNFKQSYCDPFHNGFGWNFDGASNTKELNERTRDVCIRRLKSEVLPDLPPRTRQFLPIQLTPEQRRTYDIAQDEWEQRINEYYLNGEPIPPGTMLVMLGELRKKCGEIKIPYACDWVKEYNSSTGKPLIVFAHHSDIIKGISLGLGDLKVANITGQTPAKERMDIVDSFQEGHVDVLVCSTMAAKEGLTLTKADTILFIEREWVPSDEEQAEARVHRIGQESDNVHSVYLSCMNTVDEHFDRVVEQKRQVVKAVLDGGDVEERKSLVKELVKRMKADRDWTWAEVTENV